MKQKIFDEKIESLIKEAIFKFKQYEEFHKSMYDTYLEYENPDTIIERKRELSKLMRSGDSYSNDYYSIIEKLSKMLNSHDFDIATRKINKEIISEVDLWNDYFKWKSARSTMVVQPGPNPD